MVWSSGWKTMITWQKPARSTKGKMIISVNDIPEMRQAFKWTNIQTVDISYNLKVTGKATPRKELVICNF